MNFLDAGRLLRGAGMLDRAHHGATGMNFWMRRPSCSAT